MDRRRFIQVSSATTLAVAFGSQFWRVALSAPAVPAAGPYGPLAVTANADGLFLPAGFTSRVVAVAGQLVGSTSYRWHVSPDGAATFGHPDGSWTLVSNSETTPGGAGSVTFDPTGAVSGARRILDGTRNNCAGGPSPWGTWLSCEETSGGYVFDCQPLGPATSAVRLDALGQRAHEAAAVDGVGKVLYTTEDDSSSRFYRWLPNVWTGASPDFAAGGRLQALSANLTAALTAATPVTWVDVSDITTGYRGTNSSVFNRGEGCWIDGRVAYFCTTGDSNVWAVDGVTQTIECVYRGGTSGASLTNADNVVVHAPSKDLFVAEDSGNLELQVITSPYDDGRRAVAPFMRFDVAGVTGSEVTGPCFSPDGTRLYVTSQRGTVANPAGGGSGVTYEIAGPFRRSPGGPFPGTVTTTTSTGATTTTTTAPPTSVDLIAAIGSTWRILDNGTNQTPGFAAAVFDDSAWKVQTVQPGKVLGYGDPDSQGGISFGPSSSKKYITTYFRSTFSIGDPSQFATITAGLIRDDGAVVYLNGVELFRSNMPSGTITSTTFASNASPERAEDVRTFANTLRIGVNVIAIEVHQTSRNSSDLAMRFRLVGTRR